MSGAGGHRDRAMPRGYVRDALRRDRARRREEARRHERAAGERDMTPAVGTPAAPAAWTRAVEGARVAMHGGWREARWSYLFKQDTDYATREPPPDELIEGAARAAREGPAPPIVQGPMIKPPVWTWEVPLYFWFGGMAAGASFVAVACDLSGDERSARIARTVALGAVAPCPPLLVMDLGRPLRAFNMFRVFKPRSPMSMGAWCLLAFGNVGAAAVGADLLGRRRLAQALGAANALLGGYLGSYTGVLLATTAVPLWARSRAFLGPIFVCTGAATGAAAVRTALALGSRRHPPGHFVREALADVETAAIGAELVLSTVNERRLGDLGRPLETGRPGRLMRAAKGLVGAGVALRLARRRTRPAVQHVASGCIMLGALCFRYAWVEGGKVSARDDEAVARMARERLDRSRAG